MKEFKLPTVTASTSKTDNQEANEISEGAKPSEKSKKTKKPPAVPPRSMSDAEYEEIFDAVIERVLQMSPILKEDASVNGDAFEEIIQDGKAIDELFNHEDPVPCVGDDEENHNDSEDDDQREPEQLDDQEMIHEHQHDDLEAPPDVPHEVELSRHFNENTPYPSDDEVPSYQHPSFQSMIQPPSQPKKKTSFSLPTKKGKFTPKKLDFPTTKKKVTNRGDTGYKSKTWIQKPPESKKSWMQHREIETVGTWVQCSEVGCLKWRYLSYVKDPSELPELWICGLNPDPKYDGCEKAEQDYDDEEYHIFTKYTEGSIVWARMAGYPWWPAMVEIDPDYEIYFESRYSIKEISHFHVVFFDDKVTRAWVRQEMMRPFTGIWEKFIGNTKIKGHDYRKEILIAKERAIDAMSFSIKERLQEFSFCKRFNGKWGRVGGSQEKKSKGKRRKKPRLTSTPLVNLRSPNSCQSSQDTGDDSDLDELSEIAEEDVYDILGNAHNVMETLDDIMPDCHEEEFMPESPVKPKKRKNEGKSSGDTDEPKQKKAKKGKSNVKGKNVSDDKKMLKKSPVGQDDNTNKKRMKTTISAPKAKVKPSFNAPKVPAVRASGHIKKEKVENVARQPRSIVEEHLKTEPPPEKLPKREKKSKAVAIHESQSERSPEIGVITSLFDPDVFTMEMDADERQMAPIKTEPDSEHDEAVISEAGKAATCTKAKKVAAKKGTAKKNLQNSDGATQIKQEKDLKAGKVNVESSCEKQQYISQSSQKVSKKKFSAPVTKKASGFQAPVPTKKSTEKTSSTDESSATGESSDKESPMKVETSTEKDGSLCKKDEAKANHISQGKDEEKVTMVSSEKDDGKASEVAKGDRKEMAKGDRKEMAKGDGEASRMAKGDEKEMAKGDRKEMAKGDAKASEKSSKTAEEKDQHKCESKQLVGSPKQRSQGKVKSEVDKRNKRKANMNRDDSQPFEADDMTLDLDFDATAIEEMIENSQKSIGDDAPQSGYDSDLFESET